MISKLEEGSRNRYRRYKTLSGSKLNKPGDEPDILYVVASPRYWPYRMVSADLPAEADNEETLAKTILGEEEGRYNKYTYDGDMVQYTYGSNIYRYYSDGYLTYRYLGSADTSRVKASEALMNAYKFIARANGPQGQRPRSSCRPLAKPAACEFGFDYRIGRLLVRTGMKPGRKRQQAGTRDKDIADSKRVLECDWLIRASGRRGRAINDRLRALAENILLRDINISRINAGYYILSSQDKILEPALVVRAREGYTVYLDMIAEEGD